jgi:hypothetical protein
MDTTIVIFRKDRTGWKDCFALFPELPSNEFGRKSKVKISPAYFAGYEN